MDIDGKISAVNTLMENVFGYNRKEVIGKELAEVLIPEELREAHRRGLAHFLKTGTVVVVGKCIEVPALRSDGTIVPVELEISTMAVDQQLCFLGCLRPQLPSADTEH